MNLPELCIRRPVMTTLVMGAFVIFGIFAYRLLPVAALPQVDFPTIVVSANLPGASPETMAASVATPIERQLSTIAGITTMSSSSSLGSTSDHDAVRSRPQHRRRRPGRPVGAVGGPAPAARRMPDPPSYRKGQPGRRAHPVPGAHVRGPAAVDGGRLCGDPGGRAHLDRARRGPGADLRPAEVCGTRPGRSGRAVGARASASTMSGRRSPTPTRTRLWAR